jgi:translation initiation factor eIF-2B subunit gamma
VTADILRLPEVRELVVSDFVVLPCDLVCALPGEKLLHAWMVWSASLSDLEGDAREKGERSGGLGVYYDTRKETPIKGEETDFIATTPGSYSSPTSTSKASPIPRTNKQQKDSSLLPNLHKLVYSMPTDSLKDLIDEKSSFPIRHSLLRTHPRVRFLTKHRDAHIYIFPRWLMDFVADNKRLESIGEDVIGWWVKAGWQVGLADKLGLSDALRQPRGEERGSQEMLNSPRDEDDQEEDADQKEGDAAVDEDDDDRKRPEEDGQDAADAPAPGTTTGQAGGKDGRDARTESTDQTSVPPMLAYVHPSGPDSALIRRVDTAQLLLATSLELAKLPSIEETEASGEAPSPFAHARKIAYPEGVKPRTTITQADSLVADNVTVEEKASIRESVIGANCQIREGAKLLQCLLMDGVVVGRNVKLTRCVLGRRCEVGEASVLTDCEVQENLLVEPKSKFHCARYSSSFPPLFQHLHCIESENALREDACIGHGALEHCGFSRLLGISR